MTKIKFTFNKKARGIATKAIDKISRIVAPGSLLFNLFLKDTKEVVVVSIGALLLVVVCEIAKIIIAGMEDVPSESDSDSESESKAIKPSARTAKKKTDSSSS